MTMEIFDGLKKGNRIAIGGRTIVATGRPKCIGRCATRVKGLGRLEWDAPLRSATIIVGQNKGKRPQNTTGRCASQPSSFSVAAVDKWFQRLRGEQVGRGSVAATRISGRGWYKGDDEKSVSYQIIHDPGQPGEATLGQFKSRMQAIAEDLAEHFCQDEVLVVLDTDKGKHTYSYAANVPTPRRRPRSR